MSGFRFGNALRNAIKASRSGPWSLSTKKVQAPLSCPDQENQLCSPGHMAVPGASSCGAPWIWPAHALASKARYLPSVDPLPQAWCATPLQENLFWVLITFNKYLTAQYAGGAIRVSDQGCSETLVPLHWDSPAWWALSALLMCAHKALLSP